jgi:serine/threonine-protein kinase RsbW
VNASALLTAGPALPPSHFVLRGHPLAVRQAIGGVLRSLVHVPLDAEARQSLELVLAEVLNNVVEHALKDHRGGRIALRAGIAGGRLVAEVSDDGAPMPGDALPPGRVPSGDSALDDLPEGGFGWPLIRQLTDEVRYQRLDGRNVLWFSMALGADDLTFAR